MGQHKAKTECRMVKRVSAFTLSNTVKHVYHHHHHHHHPRLFQTTVHRIKAKEHAKTY